MDPSSPIQPSADGYNQSRQQQQQFIRRAVTAVVQTLARRKGAGTRSWLRISDTGESHVEEIEKHAIMRRTGLPARDLRGFDPMLSYPSSILGRERAIVVNLEHIKAIITAQEVLMVDTNSPLVVRFVQDLQHRISSSLCAEQQKMETEHGDEFKQSGDSLLLRNRKSFVRKSSVGRPEVDNSLLNKDSNRRSRNISVVGGVQNMLPFEFRALECCLKSACRCLESEAAFMVGVPKDTMLDFCGLCSFEISHQGEHYDKIRCTLLYEASTHTLEEEAYPALDELTSKISTLNLERVRQIKSRLAAISGRVQKVRDELEHLLDDDNGMAEMYLTEKLPSRSLDTTSLKGHVYTNAPQEDCESLEDPIWDDDFEFDMLTSLKPNVEELEMLLEAYFAQIDGILQKLSDMNEYVDDTEDCINIMLDDKQNQLLQMGVFVTCANMILNAGVVVAGLFGMNIHISLFDSTTQVQFSETVLGTVFGCVGFFLIAVWWGKKKNLLEL